jgi:hypothetical protein
MVIARKAFIACGSMVLSISCHPEGTRFFTTRGEKTGALWATKDEKYHSAEG